MARLITIILLMFPFAALSQVPAESVPTPSTEQKADKNRESSAKDTPSESRKSPGPSAVAKDSPKEANHGDAGRAAPQKNPATSENQKAILILLRALSGQLNAISIKLAPNAKREAAQDKYESDALEVGESNLVQLTRIANVILVVAGAAILALLLNVWGIVLLYRTLKETRKVAKSAQASALAAEVAAHAALKQTQ